jgi:hypothetical protein
MTDLEKNKRRAMRRKRNHIAKEMRLQKQFHEKTVRLEKEKRPRAKLRPRDLPLMDEEFDDEKLH